MSVTPSTVDFTPEELEKAVSQFYQSDAAVQAKAHQWLTAAQTTPEAWTFVWDLLQPNKSTELQFFAATTLHTKVVKWWKEVPEDQYPVLKKKLLEAIISHCLGPKIVLNKLCITLSAYLLQTISVHWPDAIPELLSMFQPSYLPSLPPERTAWILLEVLTVLPEEFQSSHLSQTQKGLVRNELQKNTPQVLSLLEDILATNDCATASESSLEVIHQVLRCAASWLQMGIPITDCMRLADLLMSVVISSVNIPHHHSFGSIPEAALDALQAMATHPDTHRFPNSCLQLLEKLLPLHSLIQQISSEDQELLSNLYCTLIAVAESHAGLLVNSFRSESPAKSNSLQLIHVILQCSNTPGVYPIQETLSQNALGFWYILQDDMLAAEAEDFTVIMQSLGPVYLMLAEVMLHKSMLPTDDSSWASEEKEQFRCYRQDVADTMMYCYNVLHDKLLELLLQKLEGALAEVNASVKDNNVGNRNPPGWQMLESVLHAFVAVSECLNTNDEGHVPRFLNVLERLPFAHLNLRVINTALNVIGSCAEWINQHPVSMGHVVPLLVTGLNSPEVAPAATMALKDLARECLQTIGSFSHPILQATQEALTSGQLQSGECVRLMFTVGRVLSVLPLESTMQYLEVMVVPYINELQSLSEQELNPSVRAAVILRLKMLGILYGTLSVQRSENDDLSENQSNSNSQQVSQPVQPVFFMLQQMMPLSQNIVYRMGRDHDILQALFLMFKQAISTLLEGSEPFLPDLLTLLVNSYREFPHPTVLELALLILTLFSSSEKHLSYMQSFLKMVCHHTMQHFFCGANLSEHVDVLESFFKMLAGVLRKFASLFSAFEPNDCTALFQAGTVTLLLPEIAAVKAASQFLCNFILQSRDITHLLGVVQLCGEGLVHQILRAIGGESSRASLEPMSEILLALNKKYCDNLYRWLNQTMQQDGFPSPRVSAAQKEHFVKMALKERANKRKLEDLVREFSFICRGIVT
ncbi:hypothetical protein R5R35_009581 [Gryllus longicercus]|uniref:Importin-13 n=1 Tax=Gryllus longicercus TaxID=2509291 RepID=A0AAN9Z6R4_9ORTH